MRITLIAIGPVATGLNILTMGPRGPLRISKIPQSSSFFCVSVIVAGTGLVAPFLRFLPPLALFEPTVVARGRETAAFSAFIKSFP